MLEALEPIESLDQYGRWLLQERSWIGAFDFPFGLPRELVQTLGWPNQWEASVRHYGQLERRSLRTTFAAFCAARPVGGKFAHRATDGPAGASPSMKWVNPPVAYMMHAGLPPLLAAGVHIAGLHEPHAAAGGKPRIAVEGYPGLLAREILGRESYKADDVRRQTVQRRDARSRLLRALGRGETRLGLSLRCDARMRAILLDDARGDAIDAALCLVQAGWAERSGPPSHGMPEGFDPLEGWIITTPMPEATEHRSRSG